MSRFPNTPRFLALESFKLLLMNGIDRVLNIVLLVAPSIIIGGWGNSIFEPKLIVLLFGAAALSGFLMRGALLGRASRVPIFGKGLFFLIAAHAVGLVGAPNLGAGLAALGLTVSWWVIFLCVFLFGFSVERLCVAGVVLSTLALVATVPDVVFGVSLLSPYAPRGGLVGVRNALVVFLTQLVPLLLIVLMDNRRGENPNNNARALAFLLLTLSLYVICVSRVRSAWVMLLVYYLGLGLALCRRGAIESRPALRALLGAGLCAVPLAFIIPTTLRWSDTASPYVSSLSSLFSLERSNGRDLLWEVGLRMIATAPWLGIGTGCYASQWPQFISQAGVSPGAFGFLRMDLPLFNDYIQSAVENGIVVGGVFTALFLGVPLLALYRHLTCEGRVTGSTYLLTLLCVATSIDALVDYPFHRVETSLFFVVALGFVTRHACSRSAAVRGRLVGGVSAICGGYALCLAIVMTSAFWLRAGGGGSADPRRLGLSLRLWPFDTHFSSDTISALVSGRETELAERFVSSRRLYWPSDPDGYLMLARLLENKGDYGGAEAAYNQARFLVEGGRCYPPGLLGYRNFMERYRPEVALLDPREEEALCQRRRMGR